ncbi:E3 ubiquitin-protein ligase ATL41-like [Telopea speciosissima]|uniref:E3 ubiquitin-protein ligase ATL41-like n=1 Tax=Telopea speciosissima TaxID=54955 RepID=UPI001CC5ADAF|nr:E3 ubiquitin-protein ligase ATL41-like [Telopea speciosissima]
MGDHDHDHDHYPWGNPENPFANTPDRNKFNTNILLTAITSLVVVIVMVLILHIYARFLLRRQARRRTSIRLNVRTTGHGMQVNSSEQPNTGLEPSVIAALPVFVYKGTEEQPDDTNKTECTICLSSIEDGELARLLPNCKHMFHVECIDMWLNSHSTCPICRTGAEPQEQAQTLTPPPPPPQSHEMGVSVTPTAPPEGTSDGAAQSSKVAGSVSRLSSFRRMLSRDRSERRIQASGQTDGVEDLERQ